MADLEFGSFITSQIDVAAQARRIEALGYDLLGCGDHVAFHGPVTNTFVGLAAAAGATESIALMSGIVLLPLYPAALAAKLGADLQLVSGGRYRFGIGVGGEYAPEFEACGVPVAQRGARTDEALEVIHRLWREDDVSFAGRFNTLDGVTLAPRPDTPPPVWVAGRQEAAMRRAARFGDGWLPYMFTPDQLAASMETVKRLGAEYERDLGDFRAGAFLWSVVHEDGARAREMAVEMLSRNYSQDFSGLVDRYAVAGDPQYCRARLREYIDAGASTLILAPATDRDAEASVALMAEEVVSALR